MKTKKMSAFTTARLSLLVSLIETPLASRLASLQSNPNSVMTEPGKPGGPALVHRHRRTGADHQPRRLQHRLGQEPAGAGAQKSADRRSRAHDRHDAPRRGQPP